MDLEYIAKLVQSIVAAAPAIIKGYQTAEPYVEAVATLIKNGGVPSEEDWAALKARLDEGSAALSAAAEEDPDPNAGQGE